MLGQIATFMDSLHLSYTEVVEVIPYRNLVIMSKDKLHVNYSDEEKNKVSGKDMAARRRRNKKS